MTVKVQMDLVLKPVAAASVMMASNMVSLHLSLGCFVTLMRVLRKRRLIGCSYAISLVIVGLDT